MHYAREELKESLITSLQDMLQEKSKFDVDELIKKQTIDLKFLSLTKGQKKKFIEQ